MARGRSLSGPAPDRGPWRGAGLGWALAGVGLLAALLLASGAGAGDLLAAIGAAPAWAYPAIAAAQAAILALAAVKWRLILDAVSGHGPRIGMGDALAATSLGALAGQVVPIQIATPAIRVWVARRRGVPASRAVGTSLLEQVFEVAVLAAMAALSLAATALGWPLGAAVAAGAAAMAAACLAIRPGLALGARAAGALAGAPGRLGRAAASLAGGVARAAGLAGGLLAALTALSFLRYALMAGMNALLLAAIAPGVGLLPLLLAYPLVLFVMSLPAVPGGLGVVEATWTGVLVAAGLGPAEAVAAAFALRVVSTAGFLLALPLLLLGLLRPAPERAP